MIEKYLHGCSVYCCFAQHYSSYHKNAIDNDIASFAVAVAAAVVVAVASDDVAQYLSSYYSYWRTMSLHIHYSLLDHLFSLVLVFAFASSVTFFLSSSYAAVFAEITALPLLAVVVGMIALPLDETTVLGDYYYYYYW